MRLIKTPEGEYLFFCTFAEKRAAFGFQWDKAQKLWRTRNPAIAIKCAAYADDSLRAELLAEAQNVPDPDKATLTFKEGVWRYFSPIRLNAYAKLAGFRATDKPYWHWWSEDLNCALRCYASASAEIPDEFVCEGEAQAVLIAEQSQKIKALAGSRSLEAKTSLLPGYAVPDPALGFTLLPCQVAAVVYAQNKQRMIFGDEMRVGKSPESICWANCHRSIRKVLVITKKTIKLNWKREWERWSTLGLSVGVAWGLSDWPSTDVVIANAQILGRPKDSMVMPVLLKGGKPKMKQTKKGPAPVTHKVYPLRKDIADVPWDLVIVDEAHDFKTTGTAKQQYLLALQPPFRAVLTGTLAPNGRAIEIWPVLNWIDPDGFPEKDRFKFALRFAGAKRTPFGWDMSGVTHADELQTLLRGKYMVRRLFADVYKEIPKRRRQLIEFPCPDDRFINEQDRLWKKYTDISSAVRESVDESEATIVLDEHRDKVRGLDSERLACFEEMSQMRHEDALKRIPFLVEHLRGLLEESAKVVCAAWHNDVVEQIAEAFPGCVTLYGKTPGNQRVAMQDRFNNDPSVGLCVVGIAVCEGLDLSSSSVMVMAESDWVPKNIQQAEARLENPMKKDSSLIQYCVFQGSLDARMAQTLVFKEEKGYDMLDRETAALAELSTVPEPSNLDIVLPEKLDATGPETPFELPSLSGTASFVSPASPALSKEDCEAIHAAVRNIASRCDGGATKDGEGFSLIDIRVGHSLAASERLSEGGARLALKILRKYDAQLRGALEKYYE